MIKIYWLKIFLNNKYIFKSYIKFKFNNIIITLYNKNFYIYPKFLFTYIKVYNGYKFIPIYINKYKLYNKIGCFIYTKFRKVKIKELIIS